MSTRLEPSKKNYSPNTPMTPKATEKTAPTASSEQASTQSKDPKAASSKEAEVSQSKEVQSKEVQSKEAPAATPPKNPAQPATQNKDSFSKAPWADQKKAEAKTPTHHAAASMRKGQSNKTVLIKPNQTINAKFLQMVMDNAATKRGDNVKLEIAGEATGTKYYAGKMLNTYVGIFASMGLTFSKEDSGAVQIQLNAEAGVRAGAGLDLFGLAKAKGGAQVSGSGQLTLRFKSTEEAAAWLSRLMHHVAKATSLDHPVFKIIPSDKGGEGPTSVLEYGASTGLEGSVEKKNPKNIVDPLKSKIEFKLEGSAKIKRTFQTFFLPNGQIAKGARTTTQTHAQGSLTFKGTEISIKREATTYTQVGDPMHTNNGTYKQTKYTFQIPASLLKGPKEKVLVALQEIVQKAGGPKLSLGGLQLLHARLLKSAEKFGASAHVGASIEWNEVKEGDKFVPLNTRFFVNVGVGRKLEKEIEIKGVAKLEGSVSMDATSSKVLYEKVHAKSEAYISQVYTGHITKQDWGTFEKNNKEAILMVVKKHRANFPRGSVQEAYENTFKQTKDVNKANQAALEELKKIWKNTYNASKEVTKDALKIYNKLQTGQGALGGTKWNTFPLPEKDQKAIESLIVKYKDKPEEMAALKQQLKLWLGEGTLNPLRLALQKPTGSSLIERSLSDSDAYRMLSPTEVFAGNNVGQIEDNFKTIKGLMDKISYQTKEKETKWKTPLSAEDRATINKIIGFYKSNPSGLAALKERLVKLLGDKSLKPLQLALRDPKTGDSDAYRLLAPTQAFQGNKVGQLEDNARQIMEKISRKSSNGKPIPLSAEDRAVITKIIGFYRSNPDGLLALKERLATLLGDKNLTKLQLALCDKKGGDSDAYKEIISAQKPKIEDEVSTQTIYP